MKNILVVDNFQSVLNGVSNFINEEIADVSTKLAVSYDEAYLQILKSKIDGFSFDIVITELNTNTIEFEHGINFKIKSGYELIKLIRNRQPELKIIVFSSIKPRAKEKFLLSSNQIDAYVVKGKQGLDFLKESINELHFDKSKVYISKSKISPGTNRKKVFEFDVYGNTIIDCLSNGMTQKEISYFLKSQNIEPNSLSSIEKKIGRLKSELMAKSIIELVRTYNEFRSSIPE